jgi:hypothetical protein
MSSATRFDVTKCNVRVTFRYGNHKSRICWGSQGVLKTIKFDAVKPVKMDDDSWAEMQTRAAGTIRPSLAHQVLYHVMDLKSASEI